MKQIGELRDDKGELQVHFDGASRAEVGSEDILKTDRSSNVELQGLTASRNVRVGIDDLESRRSPL